LIAVRAYVLVPAATEEFTVKLNSLRHRNAVYPGQCEISRWTGAPGGWVQESVTPYSMNPGTLNITVNNGNAETLYRIDIASMESDVVAPFTDFPEVIEIQRMYMNGVEWLYAVHGWARQSFWLDWKADPAYPTAELGIAGQAAEGYYHQPSFVRLSSAANQV